MEILLAGDSWGIGVYQGYDDTYAPTGEGIHSILKNLGYNITNVSKAGANNSEILTNIHRSISLSDLVIFIQTDPFREHSHFENKFKILDKKFIESLLTYKSLDQYFSQYFNQIYTVLNSYNKPIVCVGGWGMLHSDIVNYSNLIPAIPSATKLIIPQLEADVYLSDFEWFPQLHDFPNFVNTFPEIKDIALASSKKFKMLCDHCGDCHPNLIGYQKIVNELLRYLN